MDHRQQALPIFKNSHPDRTPVLTNTLFHQKVKIICSGVQQGPLFGFYAFLQDVLTYGRREATGSLLKKKNPKNKDGVGGEIVQMQVLRSG